MPHQHVVIESAELLAMLEASGKTMISVEFEVRRAWWGGSFTFDIVGVDGDRYGRWRTADGDMESTEKSQHYPSPFSDRCN